MRAGGLMRPANQLTPDTAPLICGIDGQIGQIRAITELLQFALSRSNTE
jgi:hypothetical protein